MTETKEADVIVEALGIIDSALLTMSSRNLVSTNEVADLLLDVRSLLKASSEVSTSELREAEVAEVIG